MIITYLRSSSYNTHSMCEQSYFIEYVLGIRSPSGKKADKGTIVHKVLEILAYIKLTEQNQEKIYVDDIAGEIDISHYNLNTIIEKVYKHYSSQFKHHVWEVKDYKDCHLWVNKALTAHNGDFDPRNRNILQPEQHFDILIDKSWAEYRYNNQGETLEGKLAIKGTIDLITSVDDNTIEIVDWKGLPLETPIPTISGWKTMGELNVGDIVFDQYGKTCDVVGKSKVKIKSCYSIHFDDNTSVTCDDEHLWKLSNGKTIPVTDLRLGDAINVAQPLDCDSIDLPIEPYLLGVWLGDGRNRCCEISGNDDEIFTELRNRGHKLSTIKKDKRSNTKSATILDTTTRLRQLDLLHNKHIPYIYFRASFQQRLDLLRGLLDTDGNVNSTRKQAVFTNCNKKLSDDVKHLLLTLGQRPCQSLVHRNTNFKDNITIYPISFRPININPFLLPRKADLVDPNWGFGKSSVRKIIKINQSIIQKTQCIAVNSPDNTYLCTENYIPTHNTGRRLDWATGQEKTLAKLQTDPQLRLYHYAVSHLYPNIEHIIFTINFINDGGAFSVCYDKKDLPGTEDMIRQKFETIKNTKMPQLNKSWKCTKLCHFGKTTFENTHVLPILEYRDGQLCSQDQPMTKCEQVKHDIELMGMDNVIDRYTVPGYTVGKYKAPGSTE